jgi:hypothetical protein
MVKDDQGPSLPSLLKSDLALDFSGLYGSSPVCIGRNADRRCCRTYYPSDQQGQSPDDHFHLSVFTAIKQLGKGCCGPKQKLQ